MIAISEMVHGPNEATGQVDKSTSPRVSIVIPCFNAEHDVADAISSALGQTYDNVEVIVVDDGSSDNSADVIRSFGGRVRFFTAPHGGACAARNLGIDKASGGLIQFLDADDLLDPDKLERQVPVALEHPDRIVYCSGRTIDENDRAVRGVRTPEIESGSDSLIFLLLNHGLQTPAALYWRHQLLEIGGFRESLSCSQERDLNIRLACAGVDFLYFPGCLYTVRQRAGSLSRSYVKVLEQHRDVAENTRRILSASGGLTDERNRAIAGFMARDARALLQRGYREKAREYYRIARKYHASGGLQYAYGFSTRIVVRILGPFLTEKLVRWKRRTPSPSGA